MKKLLVALFVVGASMSAHASEYGCKVLLCLANPASNGGPKGVNECVPPIDQLYHDLSKGRPFPTCDQSDGNDGSSYARQVYDPYDPCPAPLQPAASGSYVVQGAKKTGNTKPQWGWWGGSTYDLVGQPQVSENRGMGMMLGARACVGKSVGSYVVGQRDDSSYTVYVFDKITWQQPQNPQAIDVYVNGQWYQRVRW